LILSQALKEQITQHKWNGFYYVKGSNSTNTWWIAKPKVHNNTCGPIFLLSVMTLCQIPFELRATQVENCNFFTKKMVNISVKFHDPRSNTFWATCDTSWKLQIFNKSRAITLTKQNKSTSKTTSVQLHMLSNIPVRFHDSRSNTFWATCDAKWERTDGLNDGRTMVNLPPPP
jgi:hypothetical protein